MNKGFIQFINDFKPDILGLQETKLQKVQIPAEFGPCRDAACHVQNRDSEIVGAISNRPLDTYHKYWSFAEKKGYSGTCLLTKIKPIEVSYDIGNVSSCREVACYIQIFCNEGRIIQAEYPDFVLFNIYFPNGLMSEERLDYKLKFYDQFLNHAENIRKSGKNIIVMGDFNTAHNPIDLSHPKANEKYSGFLPIERAWIDKFISTGYIDTFRHFDQSPKNYSWWTYRMGAREKNIGWRIDYCFVNKEFIDRVKDAFIWSKVMGSDHCPVGIEII